MELGRASVHLSAEDLAVLRGVARKRGREDHILIGQFTWEELQEYVTEVLRCWAEDVEEEREKVIVQNILGVLHRLDEPLKGVVFDI